MWNSRLETFTLLQSRLAVPTLDYLPLNLSPLVWAAGTMEAPESRRSGRIKGLFNVSCISVSQLRCFSFAVGLSWPTILVPVFAMNIWSRGSRQTYEYTEYSNSSISTASCQLARKRDPLQGATQPKIFSGNGTIEPGVIIQTGLVNVACTTWCAKQNSG